MLDTKKLIGYLKLLEDLVEKTKGDTETKSTTSKITNDTTIDNVGKAFYTVKVKVRLEKEIKEAIKKAEAITEDSTEEDWKSLLVSVDHVVQTITTHKKELLEHKELLKLTSKIDEMTRSVIAKLYGDGNQSREVNDKEEAKEKKHEKVEKEKDEEEFKKTIENAYLKLVEKISKVGETVWNVFRNTAYKSDEAKEENEKKVKYLDSILKKLKREVPSDEISEADARKLLQLVMKLRESSVGTNYSDAIDTVTKSIAKHLQKAVVKNEGVNFDAELILEAAKSGKRISTSYETWSEDDVDYGDTDKRGWEDEEGEDFSDEENPVKEAVYFLKNKGGVLPSSSHFHKGVWYSTEEDVDAKSGDRTIYSFHLYGWTPEEEKKIFDAIVHKALTESYYDQANWLL